MNLTILDATGDWLINSSTYAAFIDPTNGNRFEPGVPTKAVVTDWVKGQPVLKPWVNEQELAEKAAAEAAAAEAAAAAAAAAPAPAPAPKK